MILEIGNVITINDKNDFYFGRDAFITGVTVFGEVVVYSWSMPSGYGKGTINGATRSENVLFKA